MLGAFKILIEDALSDVPTAPSSNDIATIGFEGSIHEISTPPAGGVAVTTPPPVTIADAVPSATPEASSI